MVNRAVIKKSAERSKERSERRKDMLWKPVSFWEEDKEAVERNKKLKKGAKKEQELITVPRHITVLTKLSDGIENINEHDWQGQKRLKPSVICPRLEYEDDYCEVCSTEAKYPCMPDPYGKVLVYVHDYVGEVFRATDRNGNKVRKPYETKRVLRVPKDADGAWEKLEELDAEGVLRKTVLQVKQTKGTRTFKLVEASDRIIKGLPNGGRIPREVREEVREYDTEFIWQHLLNTANGVRFEHWGVEEPVIDRGKLNDEESSDESYPDDEDEDEEYNAGNDEDEDDDDRGSRRNKKKTSVPVSKKPSGKTSKSSSKPKRKPAEDDDDFDYDDEDDEDEDNRRKPTSKKKTSKPAQKPAPKPKKKIDDDDDEGHWSDEDDDDDEDDRSRSKSKPKAKSTSAKPKSKSKAKPPAPKSKRKSSDDDDDDEFEEDDEELEDDFDDEFEEDEDDEEDDD